MAYIHFTWDHQKNVTNIKKHNISFEEAKTAFYDANAKAIYDPDHSEDEDRFILLGLSTTLKILIVCHCYNETAETIRIISARKANKNETEQYGGCHERKL